MPHYKSNLRDLEFNLFEVFGAGDRMGSGPYHVLKVGDTSVGGIMGKPPGTPAGMPSMWGCYVTVDDVDKTLAKVRSLGGSVLMEAMEVKGVGRMAVIQDPQGAALSVITYSM